ncbi:hypothetical protein R3P38DRAFT_3373041 [Favolaschia claudopus]|uniref:Uncharacterized protein n=1 Tax=Favolaschia claudopus TaxID=2862362 RepID=A0AAV9ZUC4_9AGAR
MSASKSIPPGLKFTKGNNNNNSRPAHKRKRESTGGGSAVTQTSYNTTTSTAASKSTDSTPSESKLPFQWDRIFADIENAGGLVPPPSLCDIFIDEHTKFHSGFLSAVDALQRALTTQSKFVESTAAGQAHSSVLKTVKLPFVQIMKLAAGIDSDLVVAAAKAKADADLDLAAKSGTQYFTALYEAQVAMIRSKTNVSTIADEYANSLTAIGASIISDATGGDGTVWAPLIVRLKAAFTTELELAMVEFVSAFKREAKTKEAEAAAVNTARADAEMLDGTRPVREIIGEEMDARYEKLKKEVKQLIQQSSSATETSSNSNSKNATAKSKQQKPQASSSATTEKPKKAKETKKTDTAVPKATKKATKDGASGKDTARNENTKPNKKQKKRKAVESSDSDSD